MIPFSSSTRVWVPRARRQPGYFWYYEEMFYESGLLIRDMVVLRYDLDEDSPAPGQGRKGNDLTPRRNPQEFPIGLIRNHVESPLWTLAHVADSLTTIHQQVLFANNAIIFDDQPHEPL